MNRVLAGCAVITGAVTLAVFNHEVIAILLIFMGLDFIQGIKQ